MVKFCAGVAFSFIVLLAGYGLHALQDDLARIEHGRQVTAVIQEILNSTVPTK